MKRSIKNIIAILLIIVVAVLSYFTIKDVKSTGSSLEQEQMGQGGTPPQMPEEGANNNNENKGEPPAKPDGEDSNNAPMEKPDNENTNSNSNEIPAKPEGENDNSQTPPSKPDGEDEEQRPSDMPNMEEQSSKTTLKTIHYIMFGMESLIISILIIYLILSKFNKLTLKQTIGTSGKIMLFILLAIILGVLLTIAQICIAKNITNSNSENNSQSGMSMMPGGAQSDSSSVTRTGATTINGSSEELTQSYTASESDQSVILVENGGNLTLDGAEVSKTGGDSSNTENSEFYGVNAGILVTQNSTATIKNTTISTNAKGSNAVFSTGTDSKIYISNSKITTTGSGSARGLDATYGGYIEADNVTIKTLGGSCATLATDRGEGTVIAKNSSLETNGSGSPIIYSTGSISIENTEGTANGSQMVVIEGKNSATVTNSTLIASGKGNRGDTDNAGIMIYQSMSGDAGEGTGTFTATDSSLSLQESSEYYKIAPMFFITNTDAIINLTNCKLNFGSNLLISCKGTSEWGKTGSNGGNLNLNATNQELEGNIEIDNISTLTMNLTSSSYKGTINSNNTAKTITLKLDSNSTITLTGDSYITSLEDSDTSYSNINFNGYKLYVNGTAIN